MTLECSGLRGMEGGVPVAMLFLGEEIVSGFAGLFQVWSFRVKTRGVLCSTGMGSPEEYTRRRSLSGHAVFQAWCPSRVRALGCCGFAFFILGNTNVSKVWFGANATACLTPALGVMVAKPLAFTTVCGLRVVFSKSEGAENA